MNSIGFRFYNGLGWMDDGGFERLLWLVEGTIVGVAFGESVELYYTCFLSTRIIDGRYSSLLFWRLRKSVCLLERTWIMGWRPEMTVRFGATSRRSFAKSCGYSGFIKFEKFDFKS